MDVVLGVAVTGRLARLAMIGSPASGGQVFDQYALDLLDGGMTDLAETIVGTYREVADTGNRVAAIRLCLPDASEAETLRQTVVNAGVENVEVVSETDAATAVARSVGANTALLAGDDTVSLTRVGDDPDSTSVLASLPIGAAGAAAASASVLQSLPSGQPARIALVGQRLDLDSIAAELSETAPVILPPDASYAIARGAAQTASGVEFPAGAATMMAPAAVDATQMAPAVDATQMAPAADATQMAPTADPAAVGPELAYSQEEPEPYELPSESLEEFVPELEDEQAYTAMIAPPRPKMVLMGSAFAFVVAAFATLAVSVAVTIRPAADVAAQPAPQLQPQTVPGRFLPEVPHAPDPVALPIALVSPAPAAPAAPAVRVPVNRVPNPVAPAPAPVPGAPVVPVPAVPNLPVPGVPTVPFPTLNPFPTIPTWTTTVTTSVTPTTTPSTTTPTTTTTTPTTTTTTPTTTTTTPTTTTTTPTTTVPPTTTTTVEPTTTVPTTTAQTSTPVPVTTTVPSVAPEPEAPATQSPVYTPPATQEPAYTPPAEPAYTAPQTVAPEPVAPEAPSSGGDGGFEVPVTTVPLEP